MDTDSQFKGINVLGGRQKFRDETSAFAAA
jgi:hypothetical protein